jgi:hypothetical protein
MRFVGSKIKRGVGAVETKEDLLPLTGIKPRFLRIPASSLVATTTYFSLLLIGYDVHLLRIEMQCLKDRFTDVTIES